MNVMDEVSVGDALDEEQAIRNAEALKEELSTNFKAPTENHFVIARRI